MALESRLTLAPVWQCGSAQTQRRLVCTSSKPGTRSVHGGTPAWRAEAGTLARRSPSNSVRLKQCGASDAAAPFGGVDQSVFGREGDGEVETGHAVTRKRAYLLAGQPGARSSATHVNG
jgi:hypothetical protein